MGGARSKRPCSIEGCEKFVNARGMCSMHYRRWRIHSDPLVSRVHYGGLEERFWPKVRKTDGCWEWLANRTKSGHGHIGTGGANPKKVYAHRVAYELLIGPIPDGLELDHICRNPGCVNPAHLEAVTHRENVLRGFSPTAHNARKTHCKRGHEFTDANTYVSPSGGRYCRACRVVRDHSYAR